jgi:uncharacterized membrane protein YhaH (DUF805 family)
MHFSLFHWLLVLLITAVILGVPAIKILRRAGRSGWWFLLWFIPVLNFIMLWVFAFTRWPSLETKSSVEAATFPQN